MTGRHFEDDQEAEVAGGREATGGVARTRWTSTRPTASGRTRSGL
ncbi:hypothetical protein [Microbispora triticiradicis]|nr:hypothetical protein [Microbispora triticiradicis]